MRVLAIDAALPAVSACILDSSNRTPLAAETLPMARGHAEALMPLIERVVAAGGGFAGLDRIAVTTGPGSFTGIRIGVAAARAIALAIGKPAVGVSTLSAFAAPLILAHDPRPILACIDAHHGQSYAQWFSGQGQVLEPPQVIRNADAAATIGAEPCRVTGNAASTLLVESWAQNASAEAVGEGASPPIVFVAMLGMLVEPGDGRPRPLYLKPVDARPLAARTPQLAI